MRLLILGTGGMANAHAEHFAKIEGVDLVGAVDVDQGRVTEFAEKHGIKNTFLSLEDAIAWNEFDAVANVTPDAIHYPSTMQCIKAGKHVFCEKPLATSHEDAFAMTEAAEAANLVNMVNLTYRNVAQLQTARQLVVDGQIGEIKHVEASYLQSWLSSTVWGDWRTDSKWLWRLSKKHGSNGVLGDIGVHILDFVVFGTNLNIDEMFCRLKTFDKAPGNKIGEYDLDANDSFAMTVGFDNGAIGVIHSSRFASGHANELRLRIYGDKGAIEVVHGCAGGDQLNVCLGEDLHTATWKKQEVTPVETNYQKFAQAVKAGKSLDPTFRHAAEIQKALDLCNVTESERKEKRL